MMNLPSAPHPNGFWKNLPAVITAVGVIVTVFLSYRANEKADVIVEKTDEVHTTVNSGQTAQLTATKVATDETQRVLVEKNAAILQEAVRAARLDAEKTSFLRIAELERQLVAEKAMPRPTTQGGTR